MLDLGFELGLQFWFSVTVFLLGQTQTRGGVVRMSLQTLTAIVVLAMCFQ